MTLLVGVAGIGAWAQRVHLPAIARHPGVELAGIWGRDQGTTRAIAASYGTRAFHDFDELIAEVDVVDLALAPAVQPDYALRAAVAGRHLMLEKPLGTNSGPLHALSQAARESGIAATVFLGRFFDPIRLEWLKAAANKPWNVAQSEWISSSFLPGNPFAGAWRDQAGALFDVGPHLLSQLEYVLGPATAVEVPIWVDGGDIRFDLLHESGASSTTLINVHTDVAATHESTLLRNDDISARSPSTAIDFVAAFGRMIDELVSQVESRYPNSSAGLRLTGIDVGIRTVELMERIRAAAPSQMPPPRAKAHRTAHDKARERFLGPSPVEAS
jgi:predicted dehydrogenase